MEDIGVRMRKYREACGKKQYAVAVESGIGQSAYSRFETGERIPKLETLEAIAKSLNVHISDLLPPRENRILCKTIFGLLWFRIRYWWYRRKRNKSAERAS